MLTRQPEFVENGAVSSAKRPHVVFLNRSYWPDTEATGQLLTELTTDLTAWFDVTVIAGRPNHVDKSVSTMQATDGNYKGVTVHRVRHSAFSKHSTFGRLLNLLTFTVAAWRSTSRLVRSPDVIIVQTDPFFLPLIGRRLQRQFGNCPLVCYLQDLYPDIAVAVGKIREGWLTRWLRKRLFSVYRTSQQVVVLSQDMRRRCENHGVPSQSIEVIPNWTDTAAVKPIKTDNAFRRSHGISDRFVVMYSGNMGLAHDLDTLIDAAALLQDRRDIEWLFVGDGAQRKSMVNRVETLKLSNVRFLPYQPREFLSQSLSAADVHLVSLRRNVAACVMPSKLYGILASATPAIAVTEPETELWDVINQNEIGFTCLPGDADSLAERVRQLADNADLRFQQGQNARRLAEAEYSRDRQTARFGRLLCRVLGSDVPESLREHATYASSPTAMTQAHVMVTDRNADCLEPSPAIVQ